MYDVVVFDLWNTLILRPLKQNLYHRLARELELELDVVMEVLRLTLFRSTQLHVEAFVGQLADFFSDKDTTRDREVLRQRLQTVIHTHEREERTPTWIDGARDTLRDLTGAGVQLVLATNATANTARLLREGALKTDIERFFSDVVISCEVGWLKPNPQLLLASRVVASALLHNQPICVVGDQFDVDILAAQVIGADAVLFRGDTKHRPGPGPAWQECRPRIAQADSYADMRVLLDRPFVVESPRS